VKSKHWKFELL